MSEQGTLKPERLIETAFKRAKVLGWEVADEEPLEVISNGEAGRIAAGSLGDPWGTLYSLRGGFSSGICVVS